jgi:hypothetical protein
MSELPRRSILQALAAASVGAVLTDPAFAAGESTDDEDFHASFVRPNVSIVNNSSDEARVSLTLRTPRGEPVVGVEERLAGVPALAAAGRAEAVDRSEFALDFDFPAAIQSTFEGETLDVEITVDGEVETTTVGFGKRGFPEYGTLHVDVRDERVRTGFSVV